MENFKIKNNRLIEIELKDFGLIIPSNEIVELDYDKANNSDELYNFLSANTFSRIYNNSSVSFDNAYTNFETIKYVNNTYNTSLWNSGINFQYYDKSIVIGNNILKDTGNTLEVKGNINFSADTFLYNDSYVCTREESPLANRIPRWNNTSKRYESTTFGINGTNNVLRTYTLNYETYLTDGNHIPNKKYVDDQDISGITAFNWGNHAIVGYAINSSVTLLSNNLNLLSSYTYTIETKVVSIITYISFTGNTNNQINTLFTNSASTYNSLVFLTNNYYIFTGNTNKSISFLSGNTLSISGGTVYGSLNIINNLIITGDTNIIGNMYITGNTTLSTLIVTGNTNLRNLNTTGNTIHNGNLNVISNITSYNLYISNNIGIGLTSTTAYLHIQSGGTATGTSPIKLEAGSLLTNVEKGAIEYDGSCLYYTDNIPIRQTLIPSAYGEMIEYTTAGTTITSTPAGGFKGWVTANSGSCKLIAYSGNTTADRLYVVNGGNGTYQLNFSATISCSSTRQYKVAIFKNGTQITGLTAFVRSAESTTYFPVTITGILPNLIVNDYIDVRIAGTNNNNAVILYNGNLSINRIGR